MSPDQKADMIQHGYRVETAVNGGFMLFANMGPGFSGSVAAFSHHEHLKEFLWEAHHQLYKRQSASEAEAGHAHP